MKKSIPRLVVVAMLLVVLLGITQHISAQAPSGTVNTGALNIRTGPGVNYDVTTFVYGNTALTLLARNADATWVKIMTMTGLQGWVNSRYILTTYPLATLPMDGSFMITAVVTSNALNVRSGPGPYASQLVTVPNSTALTLLARNHDATWVKVALATGTQGWVNATYIYTSSPIVNLPIEIDTPIPAPTTVQHTHVVQLGENLFRIGLTYGIDMYDIARLNGITNLGLIYVGQVLLIP
jgi:N-acetylmuramoyl-L-alanine amidase